MLTVTNQTVSKQKKSIDFGVTAQGRSHGRGPAFVTPSQPTMPPTAIVGGMAFRGTNMGSNDCDLTIANLSAYQDGELDADQNRHIADHLNHCVKCAEAFEAIQAVDIAVQREWREYSPLPSSCQFSTTQFSTTQFSSAIDAIMAALPEEPAREQIFPPRRSHARIRWMRFAAGLSGISIFLGMLWSSYSLGYANGRKSMKNADRSLISPSSRTTSLYPNLLPASYTTTLSNVFPEKPPKPPKLP